MVHMHVRSIVHGMACTKYLRVCTSCIDGVVLNQKIYCDGFGLCQFFLLKCHINHILNTITEPVFIYVLVFAPGIFPPGFR